MCDDNTKKLLDEIQSNQRTMVADIKMIKDTIWGTGGDGLLAQNGKVIELLREVKDNARDIHADLFGRMNSIEDKIAEARGKEIGKAYLGGIIFTVINIAIAVIGMMKS